MSLEEELRKLKKILGNSLHEQIMWYIERLKDLRFLGVIRRHDPRAIRVALLAALKMDSYWARRVLSEEEFKRLDELAEKYFLLAKEMAKREGLPT